MSNINTVSETSTTTQPTATVAHPQRYVRPVVDIHENQTGYVLVADVPGVPKDGVEISIENSTLTLIGRRPVVAIEGERIYGESVVAADYRRVFELDPAIDATLVSARVEQGVLTVTLPKAERAKPRKVQITG